MQRSQLWCVLMLFGCFACFSESGCSYSYLMPHRPTDVYGSITDLSACTLTTTSHGITESRHLVGQTCSVSCDPTRCHLTADVPLCCDSDHCAGGVFVRTAFPSGNQVTCGSDGRWAGVYC